MYRDVAWSYISSAAVLINYYFLNLLWNVTMAFLDNFFDFSFDVYLQGLTEEHSE